MSEYTLFGKQISFTQAETAFCAAMCKVDYDCMNAMLKFKNWYDKCGNISEVLNNYPNYAYDTINSWAMDGLYHVLLDNGIYDIAQSDYLDAVVDDSFFEIYSRIIDSFNEIEDNLALEKACRAERKSNNVQMAHLYSREDAFYTSIGESVKNAFGNMGSSIVAAAGKKELYSNSFVPLCDGLMQSIRVTLLNHIEFINQKIGNIYSYDAFDIKKSQTFLENAKKLPEKRNDLLFDALKNAVWNMDIISYILLNCPDERETVYAMAKEMGFTYKIKELIEKIFNSMYVGKATVNNDAANALREQILSMMSEYGVSSSSTLKRLEDDCLARVTEGYKDASEAECKQYKERVNNTPYGDELKKKYCDFIQERMVELANIRLTNIIDGYKSADEAACEHMKELVNQTPYSDELKKKYINLLQERMVELANIRLTNIIDGYKNADEAACEQMKELVNQTPYSDELKKKYINLLQERMVELANIRLTNIIDGYKSADEAACEQMKELVNQTPYNDELKKKYTNLLQERMVELANIRLTNIIDGYKSADEAACEQMKKLVNQTPYSDELKKKYINLLQERMVELANKCLLNITNGYEKADEATCNRMKDEINNTTYSSELKKEYLERIQKRIEEIWSAEDGEIFDNILLNTDIFDPKSVNASTAYIKSKGRTDSAEKYLKALGRCNADDIKKAKMHKFGKVLNILAIVFFIVMLFLPKPVFILRLIIGLIGGVALLVWGMSYISAWDDITLNGKFIHPMLEKKNKK